MIASTLDTAPAVARAPAARARHLLRSGRGGGVGDRGRAVGAAEARKPEG